MPGGLAPLPVREGAPINPWLAVRLIKDLPHSGSILITRDGKACAALLPVNDTDFEVLRRRLARDDTAGRRPPSGHVSISLHRARELIFASARE
jgi:hypothetical protein